MSADSPDLVIAKGLLDELKLVGFEFQRTAPGPDGPLLGPPRRRWLGGHAAVAGIQPGLLWMAEAENVTHGGRRSADRAPGRW